MKRRTLLLVAELLRGKPLDRYQAAKIAGIGHAAAWVQLQDIQKHLSGVRIVTVPGSRATAMRFDLTEHLGETPRATLVAACLGMSMSSLFEGSKYGAAMREAFQRLVSSSKEAELFHDHDRKFAFVTRGGDVAVEENAEVLDEVIGALLEDRQLRLDVDHLNKPKARHTVRPRSLVVHQHQLYLLAEEKGKVRASRVSRVKRAKKLSGAAPYPNATAYDPKALFAEVMGIYLGHEEPAQDVRIRITGKWARYTQSHRWHPSQRVTTIDDDTIELALRVRPCPEVEAWVLSFGGSAQVLGPPGLRARIARQAAAMAANYLPREPSTGSTRSKPARGPGVAPGRRPGTSRRASG